jgi:HlyD family secretion protein
MNARVRRIGWIAGGGVIAAAMMVMTRTPIEVDVAAVSRGPMQVTVDEEGRTRVADRFVVSAPVTGRLERVLLRPGAHVAAGAVLAAIRPAEAAPLDARTAAQLRAALAAAQDGRARAEAAADGARVTAEWAQAEADRAAMLAAAGAISSAQLERAVTARREADRALAAAIATASAAAHDVEAARAALASPTARGSRGAVLLRAPAAGVVLRVLEEHERVVGAGTPVIELGDPASLEVVVDLLSTDAVRVAPGARVIFEHWGGEETLEGRVRYLEPSTFTRISALGVEEQRVNAVIDFTDRHAARGIGDGYAVDVRIVTADVPDALHVPAGALFRDGEAWAVYVLEDGRARLRTVRPGLRAAFDVQCVDGLAEGEQVIVYPGDRVADGARVVAR